MYNVSGYKLENITCTAPGTTGIKTAAGVDGYYIKFTPNAGNNVYYYLIGHYSSVPVTYTLTYTKYDDNTGDPPGAQTFRPNVTNVTIQGKNTLAKPSSVTDIGYTITFDPNGGSTTRPSSRCTINRTTSYKFRGWTATRNGTEVQYTVGETYRFGQGNKTLYPV